MRPSPTIFSLLSSGTNAGRGRSVIRMGPISARLSVLLAAGGPLLFGMLLSGCVTREPMTPPQTTLPDRWSHGTPATTTAPEPSPALSWWQSLGSPALDALERHALAHHPDIASVTARLAQAEARSRSAQSALWPALDFSAGETLSQRGNSGTTRASSFSGRIVQASEASLSVSYEIDYRGRNRALSRKAEADLEAGRLERESVYWSLSAELASAYIKVLTLRERRASLQKTRQVAGEILEHLSKQVVFGHSSPLDETRQKNTIASIDAQQAALELQYEQSLDALALLSDQPLVALRRMIEGSLDQLQLPIIQAGLPSTLLIRRPDIRRAEAALQAAHADLQAARAALFPSLELTGERGFSSAGLSRLISPASAFWNLGASVAANLFDHGKLQGGIDQAEAGQQAAVAAYQKAVRSALKDVEDNLAAVHWLEEQERAHRRSESAARESLRLATARHQAGAVDFLSVLEAQRSLLQIQDEGPQIRQARLNAAIGLFKALGGEMTAVPPLSIPSGVQGDYPPGGVQGQSP
ncbi:MAG: efflux transporter outer membrane subunit [Magnetococcales bacterium]|nr:efflux transporter outer membrane subunit [Magnetococcales bacterium]